MQAEVRTVPSHSRSFRRGQAPQESASPSASKISAPPHDPRRQGRLKITPTAMINMTIAIAATVRITIPI
jgi:hypothetical protein